MHTQIPSFIGIDKTSVDLRVTVNYQFIGHPLLVLPIALLS